MAEIEGDAQVWLVHLIGNTHGILYTSDPESRMGVQGYTHSCWFGQGCDIPQHLNGPGITRRVRWLVGLAGD